MTKEDLLFILKSKMGSDGHGILSFDRDFSNGDTRTCHWRFEVSDLWNDGFVFLTHGTNEVLDVLNNKLCNCKIL